ncbi:hypothetical protein QBC34DRAFT_437052 [Podospora aff. communis PSN243]|uniref:Uncharacterized protein n=1 Tax=Podospora aff. communis PSN243 TaxID=3040156 RepID=A0AAV9GSV0_9PEZI|nr:hypothetical protein QBC34DRAFT_437052 [Podospora aff. communis PSN243]
MRVTALLAPLGVSRVAWADSSRFPQKPDPVRRDPHPGIVTPAPDFNGAHIAEKRQLGADFMGFFLWSGSWVTMTCPAGQIFAADPVWGACCTSGIPCTGPSHICDTITLLNSRGVANTGIRSVIQCFSSSDFYDSPRTWYRQQFACELYPLYSGPLTEFEDDFLTWFQ